MGSSLQKNTEYENSSSTSAAFGFDSPAAFDAANSHAGSGVVVAINADIPNPNETSATIGNTIFGSFSLAGTEFALAAGTIQEVVNEPLAYSPIPLAPDYLLGVFNLRGSIIPVIDLRRIFKLSDLNTGRVDVKKIAIIEHGDLCLGLLFDATGEVFNDKDAEKCLFESRGNLASEQVVEGVFKMGGGRIVQILDVKGMLQLDDVPHNKNANANRSIKKRGKRRQCISFRVGRSCCALDIGSIREIVNIGRIDNTVLAGDLCRGAIDIRGDTVPIINFGLLLGYENVKKEELCESDAHRVIVLNIEDMLVGLLVDSIQNIVGFFNDELIEFPVIVDNKRAMFEGCVPAKSDSEHTILLKHGEIFSNEELVEITRGHSQLFSDSKEKMIRERKGSLDRTTLITFSLGNRYALDIRDVKEVIDYPADLIQTPNMADHIRGMVNLRGELLAVIDSRKLYRIPRSEQDVESKVLVYEKNGIKQGLVVDTVDSIIPFSRSDVVSVPEMVFRAYEGNIHKDVHDAIMIEILGRSETVCILDLNAVSERAGT